MMTIYNTQIKQRDKLDSFDHGQTLANRTSLGPSFQL